MSLYSSFRGLKSSSRRACASPVNWFRPELEALEDRVVPSAIAWVNRGGPGNDRDHFEQWFGSNAALARNVVDEALRYWSDVIQNFNYSNIGKKGYSKTGVFQMTVFAQDQALLPDPISSQRGGYGVTYKDDVDRDGKPFAGTISLDNDMAGNGWYFDPTPGDDVEFPTPLTASAAAGGPAGIDLFAIMLHEIGHCMGISNSVQELKINRHLQTIPGFPDQRYIVLSDGSSALMDVSETLHTFSQVNPPPGYQTHRFDLMGRGGLPFNARQLISEFDARILGDVYGYTIDNTALRQRNFLTTFNPGTGEYRIFGDLNGINDNISLALYSNAATSYFIATVNGVQKIFDDDLVRSITVLGGAGHDSIAIDHTLAGKPVTVDAGTGVNNVDIGFPSGNLDNIQGDVNVLDQGAGFTTLNIYDGLKRSFRRLNLGTSGLVSQVDFSGSNARIQYYSARQPSAQNVEAVNVYGGSAGNAYTVSETASPALLTLSCGPGVDGVKVLATSGTALGTALTIQGGGGRDATGNGDVVTVGGVSQSGLFAIKGEVLVLNSSSLTDLILDDSSGLIRRNAVIDENRITGLADGRIRYQQNDLRSLSIRGCTSLFGGNTFTVVNTPQNRLGTLTVNLDTGSSNDLVKIATTSSDVFVDGQNGADTVIAGFTGDRKFLPPNIGRTLTIANSAGATALLLNDSSSSAARTITLDAVNGWGSIAGLTAGEIRYRQSDLSSLEISAGRGGNTITVNNTGLATPTAPTKINAGAGSDSVRVNGTTGLLIVDGQNGTNYVTVGSPFALPGLPVGLNGINGAVSVLGVGGLRGSTYLAVVDNLSTTSHQYLMGRDFVQRLDKARISFQSLVALNLFAGSVADQITVEDTRELPGPGETVIRGGGGDDGVLVQKTTGALAILAGEHSVIQVGNATHSLDNIQGALTVIPASDLGNDFPTLRLDDRAATQPVQLEMTVTPVGATFQRSGAAAIVVPAETPLGRFEWFSGSGGTTFAVLDTPAGTEVVLHGGAGDDRFNVGAVDHPLARIQGQLNLDGGDGFDVLVFDDSAQLEGQHYDVNPNRLHAGANLFVFAAVEVMDLRGSQGNDALIVHGLIANVDLHLDGYDGRDLLIAGETPVDLVGGRDDDILIAGITIHDDDRAAIDAILAEWSRDLPYAQRVEHLLNGGGLNGDTLLDRDSFRCNGGSNTLSGTDGLDLFYGSLSRDGHDWQQSLGEVFIDGTT